LIVCHLHPQVIHIQPRKLLQFQGFILSFVGFIINWNVRPRVQNQLHLPWNFHVERSVIFEICCILPFSWTASL
jgi:hypothetical protein